MTLEITNNQTEQKMYLDERNCSIRVVDSLNDGLWGHKVSDALCGGYLLVFKSIQQILTAMLLVAVFHNGPQCLCPRHLVM